jgi:hypothetical protein
VKAVGEFSYAVVNLARNNDEDIGRERERVTNERIGRPACGTQYGNYTYKNDGLYSRSF